MVRGGVEGGGGEGVRGVCVGWWWWRGVVWRGGGGGGVVPGPDAGGGWWWCTPPPPSHQPRGIRLMVLSADSASHESSHQDFHLIGVQSPN